MVVIFDMLSTELLWARISPVRQELIEKSIWSFVDDAKWNLEKQIFIYSFKNQRIFCQNVYISTIKSYSD